MTRVSVVIVSCNRAALLRQSLEALGAEHQVIVVDNGSSDGAASLDSDFPAARFIRLPKNFGLTKAMNIGLRSAEGEFVLFLHDDARLPGETVSELASILEAHPEVGVVAPLLVDLYGGPVPQISELPSPSVPYPEWRPVEGNGDEDVPCVSGAALMVRAFFLKAMRNIDEHYGNYGSAQDLCAQATRRAGKTVRVVKSTRAVHAPSEASSGSLLTADREIGTAVFLGKFHGATAGWKYRIGSAARAVFGFRWGVAKLLLSGQKIDGTQ
ncbi:MAG: glycosyltransferase-like protein [Bryobacterales bacterium]|nr:glycosyltransferase-like protein [Bryobacterales bacterium]